MRTMCQRDHATGAPSSKVMIAILIAVCLPLFACGTGGASEQAKVREAPSRAQEMSPKPFEGREARDASEMQSYVDQAQELAESRRSESKNTEEGELISDTASDFNKANKAYRSADYEQAQQLYEQIIKKSSVHYGANVNLTLALLQQEKNEEALIQALASMALFPTDRAIPLNVQTAAVACGFSASDAQDTALGVIKANDGGSSLGTDHEHERHYNDLWDRIETELWPAVQKEGPAIINRMHFEMIRDELLEELDGSLGDDPDAQALCAYLNAVGKQLGYEDMGGAKGSGEDASSDAAVASSETDDDAQKNDEDDSRSNADASATNDESEEKKEDSSSNSSKSASNSTNEDLGIVDPATIEPHVGLPYIVAENEKCTIIFTGYHITNDNPVAEFTIINNSDETLCFTDKGSTTANGVDVNDFSVAWPAVEPSGTGWALGSFFNKEGDNLSRAVKGELETFLCSIEVKVRGSFGKQPPENTFPVSWKAGDQGEQACDEMVIEEEGICKLHVSGLHGPSDGAISLRYEISNRGGRVVTVDSDHDWKINGQDAELLNVDQIETSNNGLYRHLIIRALDAGSVGDAVQTVSGTIVIRDENGEELTRNKLDLTF